MRFKGVFAAIFFVIFSCVVALVVFVQSRSFGRLLSRIVTDISERKIEAHVKLDSVSFSVFPPGIELNRVSFKKVIDENKTISTELGTVGFYVRLIEFEEKKLTFGEVQIRDSVIDYDFIPSDDEEVKEIGPKIINEIFGYSRHLPIHVDTLLVEDTKVHVNHDLLDVRRLKLFHHRDRFMARFHVSNIKPLESKPFAVDEIWGDAVVTRSEIKIQKLKVLQDVHSLSLSGMVTDWPKLKKAAAKLGGEGQLHLRALKDYRLPGNLFLHSGMAKASFNVQIKDLQLDGDANVSVRDLRSNFAHADKLDGGLTIKKNVLRWEWTELLNGTEKAKLIRPARIADFKTKQIFIDPLEVEAQNVSLNNVLRLVPALEPLKGNLSGKLSIVYDKGDAYFHPYDGFVATDIALVTGKAKPFVVLKVKRASLKDTEISIVDGAFRMRSSMTLPDSQLVVDGEVSKKRGVRFHIPESKINLQDFGNIARLDVKGRGRLGLDVSGPLSDVDMAFKGKLANFGLKGYQFGDSDIEMNIGLKESEVTIKKFESLFGKTVLSGNGVVNYGNGDITLGINSAAANYSDLSQVMKPIFSKMTFLPPDFEMNATIDTYVHGKISLPKLKVKSHVKYKELTGYGEVIDFGQFDVNLVNETVSISNFEGEKDKGSIIGKFQIALPTNKMAMKFEWDNLKVSSFNLSRRFNLNFDGLVVGGIHGEGPVKDYELDMKTQIIDTRSGGFKYDDSYLHMKVYPDRWVGEANLLGPLIHSEFVYSLSDVREHKVKLNVDIPELKPLAVALLGNHLENDEFTGELRFDLDTNFSRNYDHFDLRGNLKKIVVNHDSFRLNYESPREELQIVDSRIISWNMNIAEPDLFISTKGTGTFGKSVSFVNEINFNSKIFELLVPQVLSSEGYVKNVVRVDGQGRDYTLSLTSKSDNLSINFEDSPFPLNNLKYNADFSNNRLTIREATTHLETGSADIRGDIFFDSKDPDVNIKYVLDKADVPVLGKSSVNISGEGIILGNEMPYNVGGEILVNKGQIVNELSEFEGKSVAQVRFLPKNQETVLGKLFNLNLNLKAENPVRISNSMMDVALKGEVRLTGSPSRPRGEGRLFVPVNSSRVFFKNNEYLITNADINFSPKKELTNPNFDVTATTIIANFKVNAKAYGDLERFNFDLSSDPALSRNNIMSLIAFGYTEEIQAQLTQGQQQNLTNVGVGSFVFDRFKISDILNKQFGLQVNLGTYFEQSGTASMLSGRSQDGQGQLGRTRSATKIELKKRLDEATTISVSSTMGGGIGQRQNMTLSYGVSKKVQLQGVYELRTNAEGEEDIIDRSLGGDIKFRQTWK